MEILSDRNSAQVRCSYSRYRSAIPIITDLYYLLLFRVRKAACTDRISNIVADAISAARPGARREDLENYIRRLEKLEEIAGGFEGVDKAYAIQAGREIRVMVKPEVVNDDSMKIVARNMAEKIQNEVRYPGQIKINVIRESRAVDYAK